jgi:hypothetical protein
MQIDSPANAASDFHEAAQQQQQQAAHDSSSNCSSSSSKGKPLANEAWWRLYCAGDVLACHLAQAMEQGLNLQVGGVGVGRGVAWVSRAAYSCDNIQIKSAAVSIDVCHLAQAMDQGLNVQGCVDTKCASSQSIHHPKL